MQESWYLTSTTSNLLELPGLSSVSLLLLLDVAYSQGVDETLVSESGGFVIWCMAPEQKQSPLYSFEGGKVKGVKDEILREREKLKASTIEIRSRSDYTERERERRAEEAGEGEEGGGHGFLDGKVCRGKGAENN